MVMQTETVTGITHDIHVRLESEEIQKFEGVLDVMKLPDGSLKFTHDGNLKQYSNGEVIRSRVNNVNDAHKYVCPDCESDETAIITATDYGEAMGIACPNCDSSEPLKRREL